MYDPIQNDNYFEWIELYNPSEFFIDVYEWTLFDGQQEDTIEGNFDNGNGTTIIPPKGYAIVTDHGTEIYDVFSIPTDTIKLYVDDSAICGYGLNNENEKLFLNNTAGSTIDTIEWGFDYQDIQGFPAYDVNEGNSLSRCYKEDINNSILDFYYGILPTPGYCNIEDFKIENYPKYLPKIENEKEFGLPFSIKISVKNLSQNDYYKLKTYVLGNLSSTYPSTQTWNGSSWKYSNNFTTIFSTNSSGCWNNWQHLRFNKGYQEYKNYIENKSSAYLFVKITNENSTYVSLKKIDLLDLDNSTDNATQGGFVVGLANIDDIFLQNHTVIVKNYNETTGIYKTEINDIQEDQISIPGYYKVSSPVGQDYTIYFYNKSNLSLILPNINIMQGKYDLKITSENSTYKILKNEEISIPIIVENIGNFRDEIIIELLNPYGDWNITKNRNTISLNPNEKSKILLDVSPNEKVINRNINLTINITSLKDPSVRTSLKINIFVAAPDLYIYDLNSYDFSDKNNKKFARGEILKLKSKLKNIGNKNTTDISVNFYLNKSNGKNLIGTKHYGSIDKYQKYPSISCDTSKIPAGEYSIFAIVDEKDVIDEFDETNNIASTSIEIYEPNQNSNSKNVVISEIYYHTHPNVKNEFITIFNPENISINISNWWITNNAGKLSNEQTKITFPDGTYIKPVSSIYITQNASYFFSQTGKTPDFEYYDDSDENISQMVVEKNVTLSNKGGHVCLKNNFNKTIDIAIYGEADCFFEGWDGKPINDSGKGVILKRNFIDECPIDTNTSLDWKHPRVYGIGQSEFEFEKRLLTGSIKTFVSPDCSFDTIVSELRNAKENIYFNIYEFTNPFLCDELINALERNVSVNIFLEGAPIGGICDREKLILNKIVKNGGKVRFIVNDPKNYVYQRYRYNHAKYLVIDNKTVIVESCNWVKTGIPKNPSFGNREWGIVVKNEYVANNFLNVFLHDWNPNISDSYDVCNVDISTPDDFYLDYSEYKGNYESCFKSKFIDASFSAVPVFSPDNSETQIIDLIKSANKSIYIEQLYIYKDWTNSLSPFVEKIVNKSQQGVKIKIILNYNPSYEPTNEKQNETKKYLEENGVEVKFVYSNWSYFTNVHNKGMIVDNKSVLISSINWNENSVKNNREAGIIIENEDVAQYYSEVFFYDWNLKQPKELTQLSMADYKNAILIVLIYGFTIAIIARDWRNRKWN